MEDEAEQNVRSGAVVREELEKFAALVEHSTDFIAMADVQGRVTYLNRAGCELVGLDSMEQAVGRATTDFFTEPGRAKSDEIETAVREQGSWQGESEVLHQQSGEAIPVSVSSFVVLHPVTGAPFAHATVQRDLRQRKQVEEDLRTSALTLQEQVTEQQALARLNHEALTSDLQRLLLDSLEAIQQATGASHVQALQLAEAGDGLTLAWAVGGRGGGPLPLRVLLDSQAGEAIRLDAAIESVDLQAESRFDTTAEPWTDFDSALSVPVAGAAGTWGALVVLRDGPHHWPRHEVEFVRGVASSITGALHRMDLEESLRSQALHDTLTQLPNRALLLNRIERALEVATRYDTCTAVLLIDLDDFKSVNDSLGHLAGDELLVSLAPRLRAAVRPEDTVARLGGDEFVVLCEGLGSELDAIEIAERLAYTWREPIIVSGRNVHITGSIGISVVKGSSSDSAAMLGEADIAMYRAKRAGHGGYRVFDEGLRTDIRARLTLASELRSALRKGQLTVAYQPVIDLHTQQVSSVEALARWTAPDGAEVAPVEFIKVAEETGQIAELGEWVLRRACADAVGWQQTAPVGVHVNVSALQLSLPDFVSTVADALGKTGLAPDLLGLEVTESVLMDGDEGAKTTIAKLCASGTKLMLDDFGTGYSSLSYLQRFPHLDALKIDRSFVGSAAEAQAEQIIRAIVELAHAFGLAVVAEGVETKEQLRLVQGLGCDFAQGYLFSRPVPVAQLGEAIARVNGHAA